MTEFEFPTAIDTEQDWQGMRTAGLNSLNYWQFMVSQDKLGGIKLVKCVAP